jgi:uncharacterized protein (TIGR02118 family)
MRSRTVLKILRIVRFQASVARQTAARQWLDGYGAALAALPGLRSATLNLAVDHFPGADRAAPFAFDGYLTAAFEAVGSLRTHAWDAGQTDLADFADVSFYEPLSAVSEEFVLRDGPRTGVKFAVAMRFRPGAGGAATRRHWREIHGGLSLRVPGLERYVQHHVVGPMGGEGAPDFDGLAELWFASQASLEHAIASPQWAEVTRDGVTFMDLSQLLGAIVTEREAAS